MHHDPRTRSVPPDIATMVRELIALNGPTGASRDLGVSRSVVLAVAAGSGVLPGSLALLREAHERHRKAA